MVRDNAGNCSFQQLPNNSTREGMEGYGVIIKFRKPYGDHLTHPCGFYVTPEL